MLDEDLRNMSELYAENTSPAKREVKIEDDQNIICEAYSVQLLKESFPKMSLGEVNKRLPSMSLEEQKYVENFSERVIEELFGGVKALTDLPRQAAQKAKQKVSDTASGLKQGAKSAASQVGQNVKDVYKSGEDVYTFSKGSEKAQSYVKELAELLTKAKEKGLVSFSGDPMQMSLEDVVDELVLAQKGSSQLAGSAQRRGVTKGAGKAFKKGFSQ